MKRAAAVLLAGVVLLAGCGGGNAHGVLRQTASRLGRIRSGTLDLRLIVTPRGKSAQGDIGFTLHGPFALGRQGTLPTMSITYTQLAAGKSATAKLVSEGGTAYAEVNGRRVVLDQAQLAQLRSATSQIQANGGLGQFPIDSWIEHPQVSDGGQVGGADTDHVSAGLNLVAATNDLLGLVRQLGSATPRITGANAKRLQDAVRSSSFDLWSGKKDRLLRRLRITADFGLNVPKGLSRALGDIVGAKVTFELGVAHPNESLP